MHFGRGPSATKLLCLGLLTLMMGGGSGCRRETSSSAVSPAHQYPVRGTVLKILPAKQSVLLKHEAIPGFMEAMTMSYRVEDAAALGELHEGDRIAATLLADEDAAGPIHMRLKNVVVIAQARPDYTPTVQYHVPKPGEAIPEFSLLNQAGKTLRLSQFRGKVLLMTFVYTRCPLADFCPRMGRNFAEIDTALAKDATLYGRTHLLTASFDPGYDTPPVLRSYGGAVTGRYTRETFAHWDFAVPSEAELPKVEQWFDLGVTPGPKGNWQHSLSTLVIGKDGKVVAFYPTNDWTTAQVLSDIEKAAAA